MMTATHLTLQEAWAALCAPRVVVAEDDLEMRRLVTGMLEREGYRVLEAKNGLELADFIRRAAQAAETSAADLIITDVRMPGYSGLELLAALRRVSWRTPVIVITAFGDEETHEEARRLGAHAVLDKPFDLDALRAAVEQATARRAP